MNTRVVVDAAGEGEAEVVGVEVGAVHKRLKEFILCVIIHRQKVIFFASRLRVCE